MATYYSSSNNQRDAAPMLYSYLEAPSISGNIMVGMNYSSSSSSYTDGLTGNSQQNNGCSEIPPVGTSVSTPPQLEIMSNLGESHVGEQDFDAWREGRNQMPFMHLIGSSTNVIQGQGLSLSLSTQIPTAMQLPSIDYRNSNTGFSSLLGPNLSISGEASGRSGSEMKQPRNDEFFPSSNSDSMKTGISPCGESSGARAIPNSRYLKAALQLFDEVVDVKKALKKQESKKDPLKSSEEVDGELKNETTPSSPPQEPTDNTGEISSAERQDLQNKLTKLLSLLDEVNRRYKQYYYQMQVVVSSFDAIAGSGAAKSYTALALQTISCQFRCLRDAITGQIQMARRNLREQDGPENGKGVGIAGLRFVDQHLRQQKAIQQLEMMQQHALRPQRGLPESSVSILRAWLFEHFLHPYPKVSDKIMLARLTGLTRSQVSNWFINARVRLWKPMVEEMYKEETGELEMDSNSSSEVAHKATTPDTKISEERGEDLHQSATARATDPCGGEQFLNSRPDQATDSAFQNGTLKGTENLHGGNLKGKQRPGDGTFAQPDGGGGSLMTTTTPPYHIPELGALGNGSMVSLTLGLQHGESSGSLPMTLETHPSLVAMRGDDMYIAEASSHLLHDFVA